MIGKKSERKNAITKQAETCEDVATLRSINAEMDTLNAELRDLQAMADAMPDEGEPPTEPNLRTAAVNNGTPVPGIVEAGVPQTRKNEDVDGMEYRKAFMNYVTRGVEIPTELRASQSTTTADVAAAIPTVVVNQIVEKMESFGMVLPLVTRTSYTTGVNIPTSTVKPVATWVSEGASSERQKKTTGYISFSKFKLRCEISMSMETSVMAISAFEAVFVRQVSEAMVKTIETAIISTADGTTSPKGILAETPATGQALTSAKLDYDLLLDAESALPQQYESGAVWCMTKKTFNEFQKMKDTTGQPIARVTRGISGAPERDLLGRTVVLCGDYMDSFSATLTAGKIFAFLFKFSDYVLNTVYDMGIQRKQDWDTEDMLTKAVMSVDGKVVDKGSLVTIAKATA